MKHLVFDTETTGKADFRAPHTAPHQPRIVQIGAILFDDSTRVFGELNVIVRPFGFEIPAAASAIHGITQDIALEYGWPLHLVLEAFGALASRADVIVAHNIQFDTLVCESEFHRSNMDSPLIGKEWHCTMEAMKNVCQLPGPYGFKWPRLEEAYRHLFNEWNVKAHDAMEDVRACARIYLHNLKAKREKAKLESAVAA